MAARNRTKTDREGTGSSILPDQQDEVDINAAVGGEVDEQGRPVIDADRARELGAVDAESIRANRRSEDFTRKKRGGVPNITFSSDDLLERYDNALKTWPPNTLEIHVRRLSGGAPVTHVIVSHPTSGTELHRALLQQVHGQNQEAEYEVKALDSVGKKYRVNGRIILPETRPPHERGQPMQGFPPGYPPPGYVPPGYYPQAQPYMGTVPGQQPLPQQAAQTAPAAQPAAQPQQPQAPQPIFFQPPAGPDPMAMLRQTVELVQSIMAPLQQQQQPAPQMPVVPPPPATSDPAVMMQYLNQVVELVRHIQPPQPRGHAHAQPQPQTPAQTGPTRPPPPGMMWVWEPSYQSFVLMPAPGGGGSVIGPGGMPQRRPPYGFSPQGGGGAPSWQQPQQPQRQQSAADNFREGLRMVRELRTVADEFGAMFDNGGGGGGNSAPEVPDDNSPVEVLDLGPVKGVFSKEDGSTRWGETILANMGDGFKWLAEQREMFVKEKRAEEERRRPVLPQGVIEVRPGDQPPPGYAFVPVEVQQTRAPHVSVPSGLPDPPSHVPPPINEQPATAAPPAPTWTMPEE